DIEAVERVEGGEAALDAHRSVAIHLALDIDTGGLRPAVVEYANFSVHLLDGSSEAGAQAVVGEVGRAVADGDAADADRQWLVGGRLGSSAFGLRYDQVG